MGNPKRRPRVIPMLGRSCLIIRHIPMQMLHSSIANLMDCAVAALAYVCL